MWLTGHCTSAPSVGSDIFCPYKETPMMPRAGLYMSPSWVYICCGVSHAVTYTLALRANRMLGHTNSGGQTPKLSENSRSYPTLADPHSYAVRDTSEKC